MSRCYTSLLASVLLCQSVIGSRWRGRSSTFLHNAAKNSTVGQSLSSGSHELFRHHLGLDKIQQGPQCNVDVKVTSLSDKWMKCPEECPLYVEHFGNGRHCDFRCVAGTTAACIASDPLTPIADLELGSCRSCMVVGCDECAKDGTESCLHCSGGFHLGEDGQCINNSRFVWYSLFGFIALILIIVIWWVVDLARREVTNPRGLAKGLELRSLAKLRQPRDASGGNRPVWPLDTNLTTTQVAGPGIVLDFNFQVVVILWAAGVAIGWAIMAHVVDKDFFTIGTKRGATAREMCIVVEWGYETQQRLMADKVLFVVGLYVVTCFLAFLHSVRQHHMFQGMDEASITHKDFVATISGLPVLPGKEKVEEQLEAAIAEASKEMVVCASVAWEHLAQDDLVMRTVHEDLTYLASPSNSPQTTPRGTPVLSTRTDDVQGVPTGPKQRRRSTQEAVAHAAHKAGDSTPRLRKLGSTPRRDQVRRPSKQETGFAGIDPEKQLPKSIPTAQLSSEELWEKRGPVGWVFTKIEYIFIQPTTQKFISKGRQNKTRVVKSRLSAEKRKALEDEQGDLLGFLETATTSEAAFVTFNTEASRDRAVEACKDGVQFRGATLQLECCEFEPDSILWKNVRNVSSSEMLVRILIGIGVIILATIVWTCVFYLPYAWFVSSSNYKYGQEPGFASSMTFSMIVVAGNALMYLVCAEVADRVQFRFQGQRELCYMLLYAFACMFNVVLDLIFTYYIAYWMMVGSGMRTKDGTPLADLTHFTDRFESYAMQRELGNLLKGYAVPATFLIPFLIEPIATIYAPYKLMSFIVRSHPEIASNDAEELLVSIPMDLSRYADIWLNIMLAVMVFYFPGGLVMEMFVMLAISHCWIYIFDHYRVLRSIPKCYYSSNAVDWWAQWMLAIPIGLLLSCAVFKANCTDAQEGSYCLDGLQLIQACFGAFFTHMVAYTLILLYVVPLFVKAKTVPSEDETYKSCAERLAPSYTNTNPMHCLRSEYIYEHDPPVDFCLAGKEHYMRLHPQIGQYFSDSKAVTEDFSHDMWSVSDLKTGFGSVTKNLGSRIPTAITRSLTSKFDSQPSTGSDVAGAKSTA